MTDKGYDNPPLTNGYAGHGDGVANGHDPDPALMLLDGSALSESGIAAKDSAQEPWRDESADAESGALADTEPADRPDTDDPDPAEAETDAESVDSGAPPANGLDTGESIAEEHAGKAAEVAAPEFTDQERQRHIRMAEALLFASAEPLRREQLAERLPDGADVEQVLAGLAEHYAERGVNLVRVAGGWAFRTATDLAFLMERERVEQRKLSRAALETLAIIAYHQPVTRAEIEDVRGVSVSKGTIDVLMEIGWVRVRGRRQTPGRPVTYGTSDSFLEHFGLDRIGDLPGLDELKAAGLLDTRMPTNISIPRPSDEDETDETEEMEGEDAAAFLYRSEEPLEGDDPFEERSEIREPDDDTPETEDDVAVEGDGAPGAYGNGHAPCEDGYEAGEGGSNGTDADGCDDGESAWDGDADVGDDPGSEARSARQ